MSQSPSALSNQSLETTPEQTEETTRQSLTSDDEQGNSMTVYYELQRKLYIYTLTLMGILIIPVWCFFSLNIALNYGLGALTSVVYLRFLAKDVERLGQYQQRLGAKGLGIFVVLIVAASKLPQLHVLPVFLGFLTYKGAIIFYMLQAVFLPNKES
ncbi:ATP synthase I chain [Xenococcus sp. PCC 7305]|uniref:ATP synthase subunit I n=1 Tax=Xenococcus sp. PCC 7305 TaxID=102125 RepID=UPI0002ABACF9|nr:ATP synthase subunit I [Xenococcus sp. PCC 7305]ELS04697.1 ATP synthase I chain [Xenococcus sp. PCC 7305]